MSTPQNSIEQQIANNLHSFVTDLAADFNLPTAEAGYPSRNGNAVEFEIVGSDEKRYVISVRQEDV